jgi:uncharacterized protein YyaL (SSP411 family)
MGCVDVDQLSECIAQVIIDVARYNAEFILQTCSPAYCFVQRKGKSSHLAYLEDYAALILGLLSLYQSDPDPHWFRTAYQLLEEMRDHFRHPNGGFYDTRDDHENLILRPRDLQDISPFWNILLQLPLM